MIISKKHLLFFIWFGLFIGLALPALAQKRYEFSNTEDIAIAFYKTGGVIPNFERWVKERDPYIHTPWARREDVLKSETARLSLAYRAFKPKSDFITIRTFVNLTPQKHINPVDKKETYTLTIQFTEAPDALYFPYDFLGERIVLMPYEINKIFKAAINPNQYNFIEENLRQSPKNTMIIKMRTREADLSRPYKIDGLDQWVLKTDIITSEVWSKSGRLLWEYTEDGYISPQQQKLNNIYEERPIESKERGAIKPLYPVK